MRIAVLYGGMSREREVSLRTGAAVIAALRTLGHEPLPLDAGRTLPQDLAALRPDLVFIALHGRFGEDGTVQGLCELLGLRHTGSGVLASALALDKNVAKKLFRAAGLPVAEDMLVTPRTATLLPSFPLPWVVKPAKEGSSIGMSIVRREEELPAALAHAFEHDPEVLVEAFVRGPEITVGVLGHHAPRALPAIEIVPKHAAFFDFTAKYTAGATDHIMPPRLPEAVVRECQRIAIEAFHALGCSGAARIDLMVGDQGPVLLEVNTTPGMTEVSLLPDAARAAGMSFADLVAEIIRLVEEKP